MDDPGRPSGAIAGGVAPTARSREGCGGGLPGGLQNGQPIETEHENGVK